MDKSLQTLNMLSMLYKPPDTNPLYIHIDPRWMRAALLSVILIASETTMEALYLMAGFYLQNNVISRANTYLFPCCIFCPKKHINSFYKIYQIQHANYCMGNISVIHFIFLVVTRRKPSHVHPSLTNEQENTHLELVTGAPI